MTLEEAIKELGYLKDGHEKMGWNTEAEADGLGIEAMKKVQLGRTKSGFIGNVLLPGETKE